MEQVHTIGIRLALDDGVSAGMELMAAEMNALERALAGLERNGAAARVRMADVAPAVEPTLVAMPESSVPASAPSRVREPALVPLPRAAPPVAPTMTERADVAKSPSVARPASLVRVMVPTQAQVPPARPKPPIAERAVSAPLPAIAAPVMPAFPKVQVFASGPETVRPVTAPSPVSARAAPQASPQRSVISAELVARRSVQRWPDGPVEVLPAAPVWNPPKPPQPRPAASGAVDQKSAMRDAVVMTPPRPMAPPPAPEGRGGPMGGDVFLDGVKLGHWVVNTLGRMASRPQGGATAFDPRMSIAWPGTLQGG
jgi:hypothetical protein